jgi:hypothetical protein
LCPFPPPVSPVVEGVSLGLTLTRTVKVENVQIIVEISYGEDGRAVGTASAAGQSHARAFSGNLELLALIENLYGIGAEATGADAGPSDGESS